MRAQCARSTVKLDQYSRDAECCFFLYFFISILFSFFVFFFFHSLLLFYHFYFFFLNCNGELPNWQRVIYNIHIRVHREIKRLESIPNCLCFAYIPSNFHPPTYPCVAVIQKHYISFDDFQQCVRGEIESKGCVDNKKRGRENKKKISKTRNI